MVAFVEFVIVEFVWADPLDALALVIADRLGAGWSQHEVPNVEMEVCVFFGRIDAMDVDIDGGRNDPEPVDAGLFGRLPQRHPSQVGVSVGVAAGLEPALQLGVEHQQTHVPTRVHHKGRAGQVAGTTPTVGDIGVSIDQFEHVPTVLFEAGSGGAHEHVAGHVTVGRCIGDIGVRKNGEQHSGQRGTSTSFRSMRHQLRHQALHPFTNFDVAHLLQARAEARGDHPFLIWEPFQGDRRVWSYAEFVDATRRVANGLRVRGVDVGDRVLVHLDNSPESIFSWLGCAVAGAVAVTTNARSVADELSYYAETAEVVGAITQPRFADLVDSSTDPDFLIVTATDNGAPPAQGHAPSAIDSYERLFEAAPIDLRPPDAELEFSVQFTSGTTSRPKGVVWNHANALWGARMCARNEHLLPDDVHLTHLPLFHTNAQAYSVLAALWAGATVVAQPRFSASRFWDVSLRNHCTWTSVIPFCCSALMNRDEPVPQHDYRYWGSGVQLPRWEDFFGVKTISWWGMTETITQPIVSDPTVPSTPLSMGRPSPAYEIAVLDEDDSPVEVGESGALRVRGVPGLSLFKEYLNNPEATEASFDDNGFMITGDRVRLLESGDLQFGDRDKDMLKVGGENVAASEIERVVATVAGVAECAVVAKRDLMLDEVPVVFVLPPAGSTNTAGELSDKVLAACQESLADFKVPRAVHIVNELPRSTLEKIAKAELRTIANQET